MRNGENNLKELKVERGYIYLCDLGEGTGSEQRGVRPVLVIKNQKGCDNGTVVTVAPLTSKTNKGYNIPTHVTIGAECGLHKESDIQIEQIRTVSKDRFLVYGKVKEVGKVSDIILRKVETAILKDNGFISLYFNELHAFKLLRMISQAKKLNLPKEMKEYFQNEFKKYCEQYGRDYKLVCSQYNNNVSMSENIEKSNKVA